MAASCKKNKPAKPKTELEKLPPITQTGANTFGCLLNGKAFTPGGGGILYRVLKVQYDPTFEGGKLGITAERVFKNSNSIYINIAGDSINTVGTYPLFYKSRYMVYYVNSENHCEFSTSTPPSLTFISGNMKITKFDKNTRIISGTFEFKVLPFMCDTIIATDGRFDVNY
jgi:hypothetical protein